LNERTISFHGAAEAELNEAAGYYELESTGLGRAYLEDVGLAVDQISRFPEAAPLLLGRVRRKILLKFPYAVIYSLRETQIRILAIAHLKRRPYYWRVRR